MDWAKTTARRDKKHLSFGIWCAYIGGLMVHQMGRCSKDNCSALAMELLICQECVYSSVEILFLYQDDIMTWKCFLQYSFFVRSHWWIPLTKGPVMQSFGVSFVVSLNKQMNTLLNGHWFEMLWHSCHVTAMTLPFYIYMYPQGIPQVIRQL